VKFDLGPGVLTRAELRLLDTPGGVARLVWRLLHREMRLQCRAATAQLDHDIMWGRPSVHGEPRGILNVGLGEGAA
jgi:hypothetical protein